MEKKNKDYLSYVDQMSESEILKDVPKILTYLKSEKQAIALGSASKNARTILKKVKLFDDFEAIVDGTNVSKAKPDPEVFLNAAKLVYTDPKDCIVFEDSVAGVQAANIAGMTSIGIGCQEVLDEADFVFQDFREISETFIRHLILK